MFGCVIPLHYIVDKVFQILAAQFFDDRTENRRLKHHHSRDFFADFVYVVLYIRRRNFFGSGALAQIHRNGNHKRDRNRHAKRDEKRLAPGDVRS